MSYSQYMPFFIGDYKRDTDHLTAQEHGIYLKMLMHYWTSGKPLPSEMDRIYRIAGAFTEGEKRDAQVIVEQFFELEADGWHNKKQDELIIARNERQERNVENGKRGGCPKKNPEKTQKKPTGFSEQNQTETQKKGIPDPHPQPDPEIEEKAHTPIAHDAGARACEEISGVTQEIAAKGLAYLAKANHPNFCNLAWVRGYLTSQAETWVSSGKLSAAAFAECWCNTCDIALAKGNSAPNFIKTVFQRHLNDWKPAQRASHPAVTSLAETKAERILKAQALQYFDGTTSLAMSGSELELVPKGARIPGSSRLAAVNLYLHRSAEAGGMPPAELEERFIKIVEAQV